MAKAKKTKKATTPKKGKYDIEVKTDLSFEELMKLAINKPMPKKKK